MFQSSWLGAIRSHVGQRISQAPLHLFFTIPTIAQACVIVGLVGWVSIQNGRQVVDRAVNQLHRETARQINHNIRDLLTSTQTVNQLSAAAIQRENIDLETVQSLKSMYWDYLTQFETIQGLGVGNASGDLLGLFKQAGGKEPVYVLEYSIRDNPGQYISITLNAQREIVDSAEFERSVDARERPWYRAAVRAQGPVWTDIYPSVSEVEGHVLAINLAHPIYSEDDRLQGVVSVILGLEQISTFLSTLEVSPLTQIYIVDGSGALVGSSDGKNPVALGDSGVRRLAAIDSDTDLIRESAAHIQEHIDLDNLTEPQPTNFFLEGDRQFLKVIPLNLDRQLDWHVVVVVPESDFTADINRQLRLTLWLCLLAGVVSTGLSIVIGHWISRPLLQLNQACRALAQGNLGQSVTAKRVYEVRELADSFNQMSRQLQGAFTQLQILNQALSDSENRLKQFLEALPVGVAIHNQSGHLTYLNRAGRTLLKMDLGNESPAELPEEIYTATPNRQQTPYPLAELPIARVLAGMTIDKEDITVRIDNRTMTLEVRAIPIFDRQGPVSFAIAIFQDITARKRSEQHLLHSAFHDALTGLPNRNLLMERIKLSMKRSQQAGQAQFALLFLDLDRFKLINDSLGHMVGDDLLIQVAHLLRETIRPYDLAARLGGDEYVLLLEDISEIQDAAAIAQQILTRLEQPLNLQDHLVVVSASIGIALGTPDYIDEAGLLRDADTAMYRAKFAGKSQYEVFNTAMRRSMLKRLRLEHDMRLALYHKDFFLLYQPIVYLQTGKIYGFEALLRWRHPQHGLILPSDFIPVAEETGMIVALGKWVMEEVCQQLTRWQQVIGDQISICVNCSAKQLESDTFLAWLEDLFRTEPSCQGHINLEITESQLIENIAETTDNINRLRALGCRISIDDFGTGYSSLAYLSQLPVDLLKMDRSFVSQITSPKSKQNMLAAIAALSHPLELSIVAEGIETVEQLDYLRSLGYQMGQGFFFAKPLSPEDALTFWHSH